MPTASRPTVAIDPLKTALVLIDLQQGIVARELAPHSAATVVGNAARLGRRCNEVNAVVVPVNVAFSDGGADRLRQPVDAPTPVPAGGMPRDWAELVPEIAALRADVRITKRQWGAFFGSELDLQLRRRGVTTIILGGIATNFGVESTAREGWQLNYDVIIADDACTSMDADMHRFSVERIFPRIARVRSTLEILAAFDDVR